MDRQSAPFKLRCPSTLVPDGRGCVEQTGAFFLSGERCEPLVVGVVGSHEQLLAVQDRPITPIRVATHAARSATEIYGQGRGKSRMSALSETRVPEQGDPVTAR